MTAGERQMEIRYLEEFIALAEGRSFGEAALHLNMAQSTLSKHIKSLELELGGQLFRRSTRRMELSALGEFYLPYAREISSLYATAKRRTREFLSENGSQVTLAAGGNLQYYGIDRLIIGFREVCPGCRVNVVEAEENELYSMFLRRETNLFTAFLLEGETPEYCFLPLRENHLVALMPEEHRLSGCYALSLGQLKNENLLLPTRGTKLHRALMAALAEADISPHIFFEGNPADCAALVKSGMGISLQPGEFTPAQQDCGLCSVDVKPFIRYRFGVAFREDEQSLSPAERQMLAYLRQQKDGGHPSVQK